MTLAPSHAGAISLAYISVDEADPIDQVEAAADAGFQAVGLRALQPVGRPRAHGLIGDGARLSALASTLRARELFVLDLEVVTLTADFSLSRVTPFLDVAAVFGARFVQVVCEDRDLDRASDNLALLARAARMRGLSTALEFMAFRSADSLAVALAMVQRGGPGGAVLLVDALHLIRSGGTPADLAKVPAAAIGYMQLCDAPAILARPSLVEEARFDRLYPGEGALPLAEILAALPPDVPISFEVPHATMAGRSAAHRAQAAADWTRRFMADRA